MYILKEARIGSEVAPHQDASFLWTKNTDCLGFWIALDDATMENGCLYVIPKSHTNGIRSRFVVAPDQKSFIFEPEIGNTWDVWPQSSFTPVPVKSGTLVLIHGALVHMSLENQSDVGRHAYTWHVVSSDQQFDDRNWMAPGPFKPL
jgi:ectoine hydroxylase-related dioxygenase (phytanoyl-CoA dioxygenase family)